jgi:hypothetical protein
MNHDAAGWSLDTLFWDDSKFFIFYFVCGLVHGSALVRDYR